MRYLKFFFGILLLLGMPACARAQLLGFDLAGLTGTETTASSTFEASGVNSSTLTRGSGATTGNLSFANSDTFNTNNANQFSRSSLSAAVAANSYFQWTFSSTETASLSSLNYYVYAQNNGTAPENFSGDVQYSLDGFATAGIDLGGFSGVTPNSGTNAYIGNAESNTLSSVAACKILLLGKQSPFVSTAMTVPCIQTRALVEGLPTTW